jgi:hypothetical protein
MNRQEVFNTVYAGLLAQNARSTTQLSSSDGGTACRYRGDAGRKCALGLLIPDELYSVEMEGRGAVRLLEQFPEIAKALGAESRQDAIFLVSLQRVHDGFEQAYWKRVLARTAAEWSLSIPVSP